MNLHQLTEVVSPLLQTGKATIGFEYFGPRHCLDALASQVAVATQADWRRIEPDAEVEFTPGTGKQLPTHYGYEAPQ